MGFHNHLLCNLNFKQGECNMTKVIHTKKELERILDEMRPLVAKSNLADIMDELNSKDEAFFVDNTLVIQVSRVDCNNLEVHIKDIVTDTCSVQIELWYTYVGTHLRQKKESLIRVTVMKVAKSTISDKKVVVKESFFNHYIDTEITKKAVHTYCAKLPFMSEKMFWHIQNNTQLCQVMNTIRDKFCDVDSEYGGIKQSIDAIDFDKDDVIMALVGHSLGLYQNFSVIKAYEITMEDLIDIEMGCEESSQLKLPDTVGIIVMPIEKKKTSNQEVVVDFSMCS